MTTSSLDGRRAVIDVGTNSVKLLVADVGPPVKTVLKVSRQTRLGHGAFRTKRLRPAAMARTAAAVAEFAAQAAELRPACIWVLATSATRETVNGHEMVEAIRRAAGLNVEIISGAQEAEFVFRGVTSDRAFASHPLLIVDVGGGSTEWVAGEGGFLYFTASTPLGTTRLLDLNPPSDPPTAADLALCRRSVAKVLRSQIRVQLQPVLKSFCGREIHLVGVGGGLKSLLRVGAVPAQRNGEPLRLRLEQIRERVARLWSLSSRERRQVAGLEPEKADVILAGALIYEAVMTDFGFSELSVSQRGLREGALLSHPNLARSPQAPSSVVPSRPFGSPTAIWNSISANPYFADPGVLARG